ncbi:hypothetical protein SAMN05421678_12367 [Actinopolymorpha cephalotaxi]|uniref:Uncharacterized protein n=1 Tax=Actinopolymorpha cephalotaxi TaxID=504797 RepID=A0A1I3BCR6_9ACTN|nr:hypothetical protein [Actinopolymorpha cephalotaxi]SFH60074.1 hypothetical protein SAMN05421678_12367 [Actinopolymorpha cephalotaxi]
MKRGLPAEPGGQGSYTAEAEGMGFEPMKTGGSCLSGFKQSPTAPATSRFTAPANPFAAYSPCHDPTSRSPPDATGLALDPTVRPTQTATVAAMACVPPPAPALAGSDVQADGASHRRRHAAVGTGIKCQVVHTCVS